MELKKNPQADLNRNSRLYFLIGLTLVLFTTWRLLEHKTYDTVKTYDTSFNMEEVLLEEVPQTQTVNTPPPPAPPTAPAVIEIVDNLEEVEESIIESTESSQEMAVEEFVYRPDDIDVEEVEEDITVPFAVIEHVPVFPGCEGLSSEAERKACFNQKMQEHVQKQFKYPATALELGISGKVFVLFSINSDGYVTNIKTRGPDKLLEEESVRIITALPKMKPGIQRGIPVKVGYSIPISFRLE